MSEEEIIEENIRRYIKEHSTTIKAYTQKYVDDLQKQLQQKENIIKEVREYIEQLLEYKKEDYYKGVSLDYVERILDILKGDLKYE